MPTKHYVTFFHPGAFFPEETTREVPERVPDAARPFPKGAFAFFFYSQTETEVDGEALTGEARDASGRFYIGGEIVAADRLPQDERHRTLRLNAKINGWTRLVRCRTDNWQPFTDDDALVAPDPA